jgi:hypothetical protein
VNASDQYISTVNDDDRLFMEVKTCGQYLRLMIACNQKPGSVCDQYLNTVNAPDHYLHTVNAPDQYLNTVNAHGQFLNTVNAPDQ